MKLLSRHLLYFLFVCTPYSSAESVSLITNKQVNQMAVLAMSYASVSLACNEKSDSDRLKQRLISVLKLAKKNGSLTRDGRATLNDVGHHISMGAGVFKASPYITCESAKSYTNQIIERIDQLLKANRGK
mgnify:FL=1|jgi:hypothetical protein|tara:strand:+ start:258 stop:647 length:390 start_codon:yes stop_codon:yes gene_type:complete